MVKLLFFFSSNADMISVSVGLIQVKFEMLSITIISFQTCKGVTQTLNTGAAS